MKEQIEKFLLSKGFQQDGDLLKTVQQRTVGQMIVNGVAKNQVETVEIAFRYIGTASEEINGEWVENRTQWELLVNGQSQTEVLVENLEDFKIIFNL